MRPILKCGSADIFIYFIILRYTRLGSKFTANRCVTLNNSEIFFLCLFFGCLHPGGGHPYWKYFSKFHLIYDVDTSETYPQMGLVNNRGEVD